MTDNVIPIGGITKLDIPADRILEGFVGQLDSVVIMGWTKDGEELFASSLADGGDVLWLMERFKAVLLNPELDVD